jgi:cell wall-associated NlpC family hydrolase
VRRTLLSSCALVLLLPVLVIGAAAGLLGGGADASVGQPAGNVESAAGIPPEYLRLFLAAGSAYGVPWSVLAGIGKVECDDGQDPDPACTQEGATNSAGAGGPMQFLASTWQEYGVSVDGGPPDRWNAADAIFTAARYLRANGAPQELERAIFAYNHSREYVAEVLRWAAHYEREAQALSTEPATDGAAGRAVAFALDQQGVPYVYGGESPAGYDCSGLMQAAYHAAGITLPRTAQEQYDAGPHLPAGAQLQPGDLVFFGQSTSDVEHVGIVIAPGEMVDAPHTGTVVQVQPFPTTVGAKWGEQVYLGATRPAAQAGEA